MPVARQVGVPKLLAVALRTRSYRTAVPPGAAGALHCMDDLFPAVGKTSAVASPGIAQTAALFGAQSDGSGTPSPSVSAAPTVVDSVDTSFAALVSMTAVCTPAVFTIVVFEFGAVTTSVTVTVPPAARVPRWQKTGPVPLHVPWDGVAETNELPPGRSSRSSITEAGAVPMSCTVSV